jgi:nicotinate phosphoribosyltransferase
MSPRPRLYVASLDEIKRGDVTDIYFRRTRRILEAKGMCDIEVRAEFHSYSLPRSYEWAVFAGLEEALALLEGKKVNVYALPEGTLFRAKTPLMVVEGPYCEFAELETAILGVLRHESSIATKAARIRLAAGNKVVLFFGLRSLHPALAPMADRAAYIGGVDGVSGTEAPSYLGLQPQGTMPHALVIVFGDPARAWKAYDEVLEPDVPRIMLVDTFYDERYEALLAAKTLGRKLQGVRLDTPGSRRGNMRSIVEEVRWTLNLHGFDWVKIIVSGGLDENSVRELRDVADGFGVGTSIAFPPSVDISMDIVEVRENGRWVPRTKRGKLPGMKQVYRCSENPLDYRVTPWGKEPSDCPDPRPLLEKVIEDGRIVKELPSVDEIRGYVLDQLRKLTPSGSSNT